MTGLVAARKNDKLNAMAAILVAMTGVSGNGNGTVNTLPDFTA